MFWKYDRLKMNTIKFLLIDCQSLYKGYPAPTLHSYCFQFTENSWPKKRDLGRGSVVYTVWLHRYYFIKDIVRAIYYLEKAIPINNPVFDLRDNRTRQWVIFVTYCISKYYVDLKLEKREESTYVVARFFKHP